MYRSLAQHIIELNEDQIAEVSLENMALCAAWYDSFRQDEHIQEAYMLLRQRFDIWLKNCQSTASNSEGCRQQPLIRNLIDDLERGKVSDCSREELDFVYFVWAFIHRSKHKEIFVRIVDLLTPYIKEVQQVREELKPVPGLTDLVERLRVFTKKDIQSGEVRDIKVFAGIDHPFRGPICSTQGDAKVVDTVPDDCAVVAEGGSCYVAGLVTGNVAATHHCEISNNVSGIVVSRLGNIRAGDVVGHARVIAKEGSISCRNANDPTLMFACKDLRIFGNIVGGGFAAQRMEVTKEITGGEIQISQRLKAGYFRQSEERKLGIALRRGLSCQDYGEVLPQDANRMLVNAMKLRQRSHSIQDLHNLLEKEADEYAGNILMFVLGEEDTNDAANEVQKLRIRAAFVERLAVGSRSLIRCIEDRLAIAIPEQNDEEAAYAAGDEKAVLDAMEKELMLLAAEGKVDRELHNQREEVLGLGRKLRRKSITRQEVLDILKKLIVEIEKLEEQRKLLNSAVERRENALEHAMGRQAILQKAKEDSNRVEVLHQILSAARQRRGNDTIIKRANDRYVKLMQRNIQNRLTRVSQYRADLDDTSRRINMMKTKLWDEYMVSMPDHVLATWTPMNPQVIGRFEAGILLCSWKHQLERGVRSDRGTYHTPDSEGQVLRFQRTFKGNIEPC